MTPRLILDLTHDFINRAAMMLPFEVGFSNGLGAGSAFDLEDLVVGSAHRLVGSLDFEVQTPRGTKSYEILEFSTIHDDSE